MVERRRQARLSWTGKVTIREAESGRVVTDGARLRNLGSRGFALVSEEPLSRNQRYTFQIDLMGQTVRLAGRVAHIKTETSYQVAGIAVDSLPFFDRTRLNRFLSSHSQKWQSQFLFYSVVAGLLVAAGAWFLGGASVTLTVISLILATAVFYWLLPF